MNYLTEKDKCTESYGSRYLCEHGKGYGDRLENMKGYGFGLADGMGNNSGIGYRCGAGGTGDGRRHIPDPKFAFHSYIWHSKMTSINEFMQVIGSLIAQSYMRCFCSLHRLYHLIRRI